MAQQGARHLLAPEGSHTGTGWEGKGPGSSTSWQRQSGSSSIARSVSARPWLCRQRRMLGFRRRATSTADSPPGKWPTGQSVLVRSRSDTKEAAPNRKSAPAGHGASAGARWSSSFSPERLCAQTAVSRSNPSRGVFERRASFRSSCWPCTSWQCVSARTAFS